MAAKTTDCRVADALDSLPARTPPSVAVDMLGVLAGSKPAMRAALGVRADALVSWAASNGLVGIRDTDGYVALAVSGANARRVLAVDRSREPHVLELGRLLGYPECCCEKVARIGEAGIDDYADTTRNWQFGGRFRLIDPAHYRLGQAAISHLPCSSTCARSLELAERTAAAVPRLAGGARLQLLQTFLARADFSSSTGG